MPQSLAQKVTNTFIKGLITEAGELTFPQDASVDELNCTLNRDGSRGRRLAATIESAAVASTFTITDNQLVNTGVWTNVGGDATLEYLVVQMNGNLYFYNKGIEPFSGNQVSGTVDLTLYEHSFSGGANLDACQFASIEGALVVASNAINTIYVERDNTTGTLTVTEIPFKVRDFVWQGDRSGYTEGVATGSVTTARKYDTANAGWTGTKGAAALSTYISSESGYPPLTLPWYSGKDSSGNFSVAEWKKIFSGTTLTGNGHFILDFFAKDRSTVSGITGIATQNETSRFTTIATMGNRVFYSGLSGASMSGTILFTGVVGDLNDLGNCYQRNDPTAEELSDLLDDDGGEIIIKDAVGIKKLHAIGATILVFATNGIWALSGVDNVFRASEYSIQKISEVGLQNPQAFVSANGTPVFYTDHGIYTIAQNEVTGAPSAQNISIGTIQTFWDAIDGDAKEQTKGVFDRINNRVMWFYPNNDEPIKAKKNNVLLLDLTLQAFYPWKISDEAASTDAIVGAAYYSGYGKDSLNVNVITAGGDNVVTSAGDNVVEDLQSAYATSSSAIVLLIRRGSDNKLVMGSFSGSNFLDWGSANYSSYAEAGYDFLGDLMLRKNAPYVQVYSRVTETGWEASGAGYSPINESSVLVSSYWDFKTSSSSNPQQAYRFKFPPVVDEDDLTNFGYPFTVVDTRLKLRGRGKSLRLRFDSEQGKNFELLGFSILSGRNQRV